MILTLSKLLFSVAPAALLIGTQVNAQSVVHEAPSASTPPPAPGESAAERASSSGNQQQPEAGKDIVVSASKRTETVLKAPVAVTVLTPKLLQDSGVIGLADLTSTAPSVQLRDVGSADVVQATIRGITNTDFNQAGNPAVATYVDGIYVGHSEGLSGALFDLQRIEVLKGPQGTLYGRNSTGGNLNIITADPEPKFAAYADGAYGNYDDVLIHGMVNVPVIGDLALRGAFVVHRNDGYYDTRGTTARNYGVADDYGARLTALWTPGNFSWRLSLEDYVQRGTPGLQVVTGPDGKPVDGLPVFSRPVPPPEPFLRARNLNLRSRMDYKISSALSVSYLAGYEDFHELIQATVSDAGYTIYRPREFQNFSQEVDVSFDTGRFHNIIGASYFHMLHQNFDIQNYGAIGILEGTTQRPNHVRTSAYGVFDQGTYNLADSLRIIAGVRYSSEHQTNDGEIDGICPISVYAGVPLGQVPRSFTGPGCFVLPYFPAAGTFSDVTWKAGADYDIAARTSAYLTVSTGFKAGGTNAGGGVSAANALYKPEKDINYELGLKTRLFDNRLSINSAIFYTSYTDIQVGQIIQQTSVTTNAAAAAIYGAELEAQWTLTPNDRVNGFINYIHATYTNYTNALNPVTGLIIPRIDGNHLQDAPEVTFRVQYAHDFVLSNGATITPDVAIYWQAANYLSPINLPVDRVGSYSKTDLNLTYFDTSHRWSITGFVHNLENNDVRINEIQAFGETFSDYSMPRTFGVRLSLKY